MLTVQRMIKSVEADVRNGSSHRRYHGNTTGAHKRHAAMGQANWSGGNSGPVRLRRSQIAVTNPTKKFKVLGHLGPTEAKELVRKSIEPSINAISTLILIVTTITIYLADRFGRERARADV